MPPPGITSEALTSHQGDQQAHHPTDESSLAIFLKIITAYDRSQPGTNPGFFMPLNQLNNLRAHLHISAQVLLKCRNHSFFPRHPHPRKI